MSGPGAYATAYALKLRANDPTISEEEAFERASRVYMPNDTIIKRERSEPLDVEARAIFATYAVGGTLPPVETVEEQNEFLTDQIPADGPFVFGDAVVVRSAEAIPEKPGTVSVVLTALPRVPRGGLGEFSVKYTKDVSTWRRARRLDPRQTGKLLRTIAYSNNKMSRNFSHILKLLGPKPAHNHA